LYSYFRTFPGQAGVQSVGTWQNWDDNELGMMEAVVTKMSRIIAHVGSGEKGSHVLQKLQVSSLQPALLHCARDATVLHHGQQCVLHESTSPVLLSI
jgi:hypothetical protein